MAVAVVGLLIGVVGFSVANRPPGPIAPSPSVAPVAVLSTPAPVLRPAPSPWQARTIEQIRPRPLVALGQDGFGVIATIAGERYLAVLEEIEPGHLNAIYRIPFPRPAREGTLALAQLWSRAPGADYVALGSWGFSLDPLTPETSRGGSVIDVTVRSRPELRGRSRLVWRGYRLRVRAEGRLNAGVLWVDIWMGPGRLIAGDDGILGGLGVARLADLAPRRGPGLYNRCRWDVGPQAARPRSSHDEAGCGE